MSTDDKRHDAWLADLDAVADLDSLLEMVPSPDLGQAQGGTESSMYRGVDFINPRELDRDHHHERPGPHPVPSHLYGAGRSTTTRSDRQIRNSDNPRDTYSDIYQTAYGHSLPDAPSEGPFMARQSRTRGQNEFNFFDTTPSDGMSTALTTHIEQRSMPPNYPPGASSNNLGLERTSADLVAGSSQHQDDQRRGTFTHQNAKYIDFDAGEGLRIGEVFTWPVGAGKTNQSSSLPQLRGEDLEWGDRGMLANVLPESNADVQSTNRKSSVRQSADLTKPNQARSENAPIVPPRKTIKPVTPERGVENYTFQGRFTALAAAMGYLDQKEKIQLGIKNDDVAQVKLGINRFCRRAFEALTQVPSAPGEHWKPDRKLEYQGGQDNAMTAVTNMMASQEDCLRAEAMASAAVHQAVELHEVGMKKGHSEKVKMERGHTCSGRINALIAALHSNKLCCKDLLEGRMESLIYTPKQALKTKRDNTASNAAKAGVLKNAAKLKAEKAAHPLEDAVNDEGGEQKQPPRKKRNVSAHRSTSGDPSRQPTEIQDSQAAVSRGGSKKAPASNRRGDRAKKPIRSNFESDDTAELSTLANQSMPSLQTMSSFDPAFDMGNSMHTNNFANSGGTGLDDVLLRDIFGDGISSFPRPEPPARRFDTGAMTATSLRNALPNVSATEHEGAKTTGRSSRF
ncbi:uncharacterized protein CLAFUR5_10863 [Fulvia fulva]|uniref:Uncharacterized protein n=1 Tax=Passalora fulva TaxID=5499 RepID=A0A9Q8USR1_PASFU|nr:uncharacterized protein CLAFUR5_10863 [Fulvia fulva]KAK4619253.1 hypothetical protein CLAFUR0_11839 [Fulvia fulva]UJO21056.1 hypothetical protein CLAFUR5_10863 [Fulvia fulva]